MRLYRIRLSGATKLRFRTSRYVRVERARIVGIGDEEEAHDRSVKEGWTSTEKVPLERDLKTRWQRFVDRFRRRSVG